MLEPEAPVTEAGYIDAPSTPLVRALYEYWDELRGERRMPARADIDPTMIPALLPYVIMYDAAPDGGYSVRLVGEEVVRFVGQNLAGKPSGSSMTPRSAAAMNAVLDAVTHERAPKFRAGKAHWQSDKTYRDFEACFLPLSNDGDRVNIIFGGISFPS